MNHKKVVLAFEKGELKAVNDHFGSYGQMNTSWSGEDVRGFAKIFGNRVSIYHKINALGHE